MILDPIDQRVRDQGFNFVPFDRYLASPFQPKTLDMSGSGLSSFGMQRSIPTGRFGFPVLFPGRDGGGGSTTTGPADTSGFDYEFDALGGLTNKDNVGLTEEEQEAIDNMNNPGLTKGMIGTIGLTALGFLNPFTAMFSLKRAKDKQTAALEEAAREAAAKAEQDRNRDAGTGGYQAGYSKDFMEGSGSKDAAQEASSPGSSGPGGSDSMGSFMDGGIVDLVDIYD